MPRARLYSLDDLEDIPGTRVFTARRARQGYHLHKFCMSLMQEDILTAFRADERAYLDRYKMTEEQKTKVAGRYAERQNVEVDKLQKAADKFNTELKAFKAKNPS